jgi:hypothetical protein
MLIEAARCLSGGIMARWIVSNCKQCGRQMMRLQGTRRRRLCDDCLQDRANWQALKEYEYRQDLKDRAWWYYDTMVRTFHD